MGLRTLFIKRKFRKKSRELVEPVLTKIASFREEYLTPLPDLDSLTNDELEKFRDRFDGYCNSDVMKGYHALKTAIRKQISTDVFVGLDALAEEGYLTAEDQQVLNQNLSFIDDYLDGAKKSAGAILRARTAERERIRTHDEPLANKAGQELDRLLAKFKQCYGNEYHPCTTAHYTNELEDVLRNIWKFEQQLAEVVASRELVSIESSFTKDRLYSQIANFNDNLERFYHQVCKKIDLRKRFRQAILDGDGETLKSLSREHDCNLRLAEPAPTTLRHGISLVKLGPNGSWETVEQRQGKDYVYTVREYVDVLEDVLKKGLRASERRHGNTCDREHPGIYFSTGEEQEYTYGTLQVKIPTVEIPVPIFQKGHANMMAGGWEYIVFAERVKGNFEVILDYVVTDNLKKYHIYSNGMTSIEELHLQIKDELDRRGISYQVTPGFKEMELECSRRNRAAA